MQVTTKLRALILILAFALFACSDGPRVDIITPDGKPIQSVKVEIADTNPKRETGLMYRSHLDENAGMIFVFAAPSRLKFWMKNTEIPLDMIFADPSGKIVGIVENARPYDESSRGVDADASYVLEVNGGFCARHHVTAGDYLKFSGFVPRAQD